MIIFTVVSSDIARPHTLLIVACDGHQRVRRARINVRQKLQVILHSTKPSTDSFLYTYLYMYDQKTLLALNITSLLQLKKQKKQTST